MRSFNLFNTSKIIILITILIILAYLPCTEKRELIKLSCKDADKYSTEWTI